MPANTMTREQEVIYRKVYAPAYIQKSAELGAPINTEEELGQALEDSAMIQMLLDRQQGGVSKSAHVALRQALGFDARDRADRQAAAVKAAAAPAQQDEEVRQAIRASLGL